MPLKKILSHSSHYKCEAGGGGLGTKKGKKRDGEKVGRSDLTQGILIVIQESRKESQVMKTNNV